MTILLHILPHKKDQHLYLKMKNSELSGGAPCLEPGSEVVLKPKTGFPVFCTLLLSMSPSLPSFSAKPKPISSAMCSVNNLADRSCPSLFFQ